MEINPEINELKIMVHEHQAKITTLETLLIKLEENQKSSARQTVWQLIGVVASTCLIIVSVLSPRIEAIEKNTNQRFEAMEKRIEQSERNMDRRFEDFKKDQDKRFEDFKQEMLGLLKK